MERNTSKTFKLTLAAMFGALAAILMLFELPIFFTLPFIKLDFSDVPVVLGAYILGPFWGCAVAFIKIGLNFLLNGTTTGGVGEFANLLFTMAYLVPATLIYQKLRTKKGAILSLVLASLVASVGAVLIDWVLVFPFYVKLFFGGDMSLVVDMATGILPFVKTELGMYLLSVFPANLLKYALESVVTFFAYMPLRKLINSVLAAKKEHDAKKTK